MNFRTLLLTNTGTTNSVITDTTNRYGLIITVGGAGGDFSHTAHHCISVLQCNILSYSLMTIK